MPVADSSPKGPDPAPRGSGWRLRSGMVHEAIFGINDGLVATVGLVSGEALAHQSHRSVLIAALSALGANMVSMAVGSYLATTSENDFNQREIRQQKVQIERRPERERRRTRRLLHEIGIPAGSLFPVEANIMRNRSRWLNFLVREQLGIHQAKIERPLENAITMGIAVMLGSAPSIIPYLLPFPVAIARNLSWIFALTAALALGAFKGRITGSSIARSAAWFGFLVSLSSLVGSLIGFAAGTLGG